MVSIMAISMTKLLVFLAKVEMWDSGTSTVLTFGDLAICLDFLCAGCQLRRFNLINDDLSFKQTNSTMKYTEHLSIQSFQCLIKIILSSNKCPDASSESLLVCFENVIKRDPHLFGVYCESWFTLVEYE